MRKHLFDTDDGVPVFGVRTLLSMEAPKPLNSITWIQIGDSIQVDAGHFDLAEVALVMNPSKRDQSNERKSFSVPFYVSDRFVISPNDVIGISVSFFQLVRRLLEEGILDPAQLPEELRGLGVDAASVEGS